MNIQKLMQPGAGDAGAACSASSASWWSRPSVGGGMVTVKMSGHKQLRGGARSTPRCWTRTIPAMLQDLDRSPAVNEAGRKVDEAMQEKHRRSMAAEPARACSEPAPPSPRRCRSPGPAGRRAVATARASVRRPRRASPTTCSRCRPAEAQRARRRRSSRSRRSSSTARAATRSPPSIRAAICTDPRRDRRALCVVEEPFNIQPIERTGEYHGLYHVLLGALSPQRGIGPGPSCAIAGLLARLDGVEEVILATNPNVEGEATALYLARLLKAARRRGSPASPSACRSAATSSTPTR